MTTNADRFARMEQVVSVGRVVHFVDLHGIDRAALVTAVYLGGVAEVIEAIDLVYFTTSGFNFAHNVGHDRSTTGRITWHWPEYVAPRPVVVDINPADDITDKV